jgi:hypothetical protein
VAAARELWHTASAAVVPGLLVQLLQRVPPLIVGPAFAAFVCALAVAMGRRVVLVVGRPLRLTPLERGLTYASIGAGCLQFVPYVLGAIGWLTPGAVLVALTLLAILLRRDVVHVTRRCVAEIASLRGLRPPPAAIAWLCAIVVFVCVIGLRSMSVGDMGDDDGYHLTAPRRWLEAGSLTYLPSYTHTNGSLGFEMLYLMALAVAGPAPAKLLHLGAGIFCLLAVFLVARRLTRRAGSDVQPAVGVVAGMIAVSLLLVPNPLYDYPFLMSVAYNDLAVCWMSSVCALLMIAWRQTGDREALLLAALFSGIAASFKFTALAVSLALNVVILLDALRQRAPLRRTAWLVVGTGALSVLPVVPWLYRNWRLTGNPVYPLLSSVFPTRDWSQEQSRVTGQFFRLYNWAKGAGAHLSAQNRALLIVAAGVGIVAAVSLAYRRSKDAARRDVIVFSTVMVLASLAVTALYFRFWLPSFAVVCALIGALVAERPQLERRAVPIAAGLVAVGLFLHERQPRFRMYDAGLASDVRIALGLSSAQEYRKSDIILDMWSTINEITPRDARVLIVAFYTTFGASSGGAFWCKRACYVTDSHLQDYIRLEDWPSFRASVTNAGIGYVVISDEQFSAGRIGFSFPAGQNEYAFGRRLALEDGELVHRSGHLELYRLRTASREAALTNGASLRDHSPDTRAGVGGIQ